MATVDEYRIKVKNDDGEPEAQIQTGTIIGPFGVSDQFTNGVYRVTHLHSGLKIRQLGGNNRENVLKATKRLWIIFPWWKSHSSERIAVENNTSRAKILAEIEDIASEFGLEGEPETEDGT